jgi:prevent-host-death family protein
MRYVSAAEFKAKCLKLMDEVQAGGEPITITKRGKPVATVIPADVKRSGEKPGVDKLFGSMKGTVTKLGEWDETGPVDPDWEAEWEAKWDERGLRAPKNAA